MADPHVESAYAYLRGHSTGDLRFEEHLRPVKYVIAPSGRLVASVMVAMIQAVDTVLYVPEYREDAMELGVTLEPLAEDGPDGGLTDRWRIYHGEPEDVRWAWVDVDAARHDGLVIDGSILHRPNPLTDAEPRLCRSMNETRQAELAAMCQVYASVKVEHPVMVGVDPLGLDVRGQFEVYRIPAAETMDTADAAQSIIDAMAKDAVVRADALH